MKRALVLGGGGPVGLAWHRGLAVGLREGGVELREADLVVGTSAGSLVGTRIAAGHDVGEAEAGGVSEALPLADGGIDGEKLMQIYALWNEALQPEQMDAARRRAIGKLACEARTCDVETWVAHTGGVVGVDDWPASPGCDLRIVAIDCELGERVCFDRTGSAPLERAIAASCCVPGLFPPIEIGGHRFIDGGVGSATSADFAVDAAPDVVIAIAPMSDRTVAVGTCAERALEQEVRSLRAAGAEVCVVLPDEGDANAFGGDLMSTERGPAVFERGIERGRALARTEAAIWNR